LGASIKWLIGVGAFLLLASRTVFAVKPGVVLGSMPEMEYARRIVARVYARFGYELTVTSGYEGSHDAASLHYKGLAEDYRTRDLRPGDVERIASEIRAMLGTDYDVIVETNHLHVEFDPKE